MFNDQARRCAARFQGYECQEMEGDFMLAFADGTHAVNFCLTVRTVHHRDPCVSRYDLEHAEVRGDYPG